MSGRLGGRVSRGRAWAAAAAFSRPTATSMLRISYRFTTETGIVLRLEGEINGLWVDELRGECRRALSSESRHGRPVVLDLAGVFSIDARGIALFRELTGRGVLAMNCSPYVAELLRGIAKTED